MIWKLNIKLEYRMKYIKKVLENDMNIIFVPMENTHIVAMGFFVKAGSRNEDDENNGVAHFLEHMMFKGTSHRTPTQLFTELDSVGAIYNAVTTTQHTYYYVYGHMNSTKKILDIVLDIYINPLFNTKEINLERKVILEEMGMIHDTPLMKLYSAMHKKIFKGTSLARDVIGTSETIESIGKRDFNKFRDSLYKPENTVFVIAGNISPSPLYKMIRQILAPIPNLPLEPRSYFDEKQIIFQNMQKQVEPYVYVQKNNYLHQAYVLLSFPMYDLYSYKNNEIDLLSQLLSNGFSSRLNKALREENGITYVSETYPIVYSDCGLFLLQMILNPVELFKGLKIMLRELKKTKNELMTKEELIKIVNLTKNETVYSLTTPMEMLRYFGLNFLANREFKPNLDQEFASIKSVSREQIRDVADEIFDRNKINLFIYGNVNVGKNDFDFLDV